MSMTEPQGTPVWPYAQRGRTEVASRGRKRRGLGRWLLALAGLLLVATLAGGGVAYHLATAPKLTGTWVGQGRYGVGGLDVPLAVYVSLDQSDNTHVSGSGEICTKTTASTPTTFTLLGTTTNDYKIITLLVSQGNASSAGKVTGSLIGDTLHLALPDSLGFLSGTLMLSHGTDAAFQQTCQSLPALNIGG